MNKSNKTKKIDETKSTKSKTQTSGIDAYLGSEGSTTLKEIIKKINPTLSQKDTDYLQYTQSGVRLKKLRDEYLIDKRNKQLDGNAIAYYTGEFNKLKDIIQQRKSGPKLIIEEESKEDPIMMLEGKSDTDRSNNLVKQYRDQIVKHVPPKIIKKFNDVQSDHDIKEMVDHLSKSQVGQGRLEKVLGGTARLHGVDLNLLLDQRESEMNDQSQQNDIYYQADDSDVPLNQSIISDQKSIRDIVNEIQSDAVRKKAHNILDSIYEHKQDDTQIYMAQHKIDERQNDHNDPSQESQVQLSQSEPSHDQERNDNIQFNDIISLYDFIDQAHQLGVQVYGEELNPQQQELFESELTDQLAMFRDYPFVMKQKSKEDRKAKYDFVQGIYDSLRKNGKQVQYISGVPDTERRKQETALEKSRKQILYDEEKQRLLTEHPEMDINKINAQLDKKYKDSGDKPSSRIDKGDRHEGAKIISEFGNMSVENLADFIVKAYGFISKISGDIKPQAGLNQYAKVTQVYNPKIVKKEPTQFNLNSGQAFKIREC